MFDMRTLLILVPGLPLAAAVVTAVLGPRVLRGQSHLPAVIALLGSCACSLLLVNEIRHEQKTPPAGAAAGNERVFVTLCTWVSVPDAYVQPPGAAGESDAAATHGGSRDFRIDVTLRADALTAVMLAMVTFISTLIVIYSIGYMQGERGYWRYFAYVSLFVFSMTMLVSVSNFLLLYVFWEAVGLCSYLLIGFWYEKPAAAAAGKKAFLVNRVGDFGFALAVFLIWTTYGTLNFHDTLTAEGTLESAGVLGQTRLLGELGFVAGPIGTIAGMTALAICLFLLAGACGKSAQFPLHVWLPDAMEGPTPVSALIHAATMVTAGVYLVARCWPLFLASPEAQVTVAVVGGFTAIFAALIALTQFDLKRVLAYSTISQLGYMFLAMGTGTLAGATAGMFHLVTHAFFKALLFLGAGSVMHAMGGVIDMRRFSGLRKTMPVTHLTFLVGCLALAGVFPLAGFWSKDAVLAAVHERAADAWIFRLLFVAGLVTAFLTAFYAFRAFFMTFHGGDRVPHEAGHHAHESPAVMGVPLVVLACCAALVGLYFEATHALSGFLATTPSLVYHADHAAGSHQGFHGSIAILSTVIAIAGIGAAAYLYLGPRNEVDWMARSAQSVGLYQLSYGKFFLDEIYALFVVWPLRGLAATSYWLDRWLVDGLVNAVGRLPGVFGWLMRSLQMGLVPFYALAMVLGLAVIIAAQMLFAQGSP
jgi:NADH-quinone oxidoreductase subunit L